MFLLRQPFLYYQKVQLTAALIPRLGVSRIFNGDGKY